MNETRDSFTKAGGNPAGPGRKALTTLPGSLSLFSRSFSASLGVIVSSEAIANVLQVGERNHFGIQRELSAAAHSVLCSRMRRGRENKFGCVHAMHRK